MGSTALSKKAKGIDRDNGLSTRPRKQCKIKGTFRAS